MSKLSEFLFAGARTRRQRNALRVFWGLVIALPVGIFLLFLGLSFTDLPSVTELENPKNNVATRVMAGDGTTVLGRIFIENRVMVDFSELGPHLEPALVSTEDERYYDHSGIDWKALLRAVVKTGLLGQRSSGGGSTITQQLAKQLFTGPAAANIWERGVEKLKEWIIAVRLERKYTKQEIIAMYLNRYDFINGAHGIRAASENYFGGRKPAELEVQQAAMLVGMLKNSSLYDPLRNPEGTMNRRNQVLAQMLRNDRLSRPEFDSLRQLPLGIEYSHKKHDDGLAPYFRQQLTAEIKDILAQERYHKSAGERYDVFRDGLTVYTTIDPAMQEIAEREARQHLAGLQGEFFRHWRGMDPWTYTNPASESEVRVATRQAALTRDIRASDRYQRHRSRILAPVLRRINQRNDLTFHADDREVDRIVRESREGGVISDLLRSKLIGRELAAKYRSVMKMDAFEDLTKAWDELQRTVDKDFATPVDDMRVFTYGTSRLETDTSGWTPLDSVRYHNMILQIGSVAIEPTTGHVKTWVGGNNFKWFQFDHVTTRRQVGSTFKPFVYAASIALRGISPCMEVIDQPITIAPGDGSFYLREPWTPRNSHGSYTGEVMNLYYGLKNSVNTVSAYLMQELGSTDPVRDMVASMGVDKAVIPDAPSIALGSVDLTVLEMGGAYNTFARNGLYVKPVYLLRIEDRTGRTIYEHMPEERQAINPGANYAMVDMLRNASVGALGGVKGPVGGKTGTTNDQTDGWYMGITPELVVATWVGGDDRWIRFRSLGLGGGSHMAKPFFRRFVSAAQRDERITWNTERDFFRPRGSLGIELDCQAYSSGQEVDPEELEREQNDDALLPDDPFGGGGIDNQPDF